MDTIPPPQPTNLPPSSSRGDNVRGRSQSPDPQPVRAAFRPGAGLWGGSWIPDLCGHPRAKGKSKISFTHQDHSSGSRRHVASMCQCPLRGIFLTNSWFYALLQIGWNEGGSSSVVSHMVPTILVILATSIPSNFPALLFHVYRWAAAVAQCVGNLPTLRETMLFAKRLSHSEDIKRDKRRVFHYVDQHESFQVTPQESCYL